MVRVMRNTRTSASLVLASLTLLVPLATVRGARADEPSPPAVVNAGGDGATPPSVEPPLAGFHNGLFFLRDKDDVFRLYVQGRVHVDALTWLGPGVGSLGPDSALKTTLTLRRVRTEIAGEFFNGEWQWQISGDFGPTSVDNPAARTDVRNCTVSAAGASTCADQTSAVEAPLQRVIPTDAFVNYAPSPWVNVQVGQYLLPFTMEARVSDNTTPFLERALVVRNLGAPFTRDIGAMVWGEAPNRFVYYTVGVYNGDGANRPNADSRFDVVGRAFVRPFATAPSSPLKWAQVGASFRYGSRDPKQVGYDVPSLTTQAGYAFWKSTYKDSLNRTVHIIPSNEQGAIAAELFVPYGPVDFTGEAIYTVQNTREALDGYQLSPYTERIGSLKGWGYYAQVGAWILGSRDLIGAPPSYGKPLHADLKAPSTAPTRALQALVKVEQLHLTYSGFGRGGAADPKTPNGDIDVLALSVGLNYWATRHVRVGINYINYSFPDAAPLAASAPGGPVQSPNQRAVTPAQSLAAGVNDGARDGGHALHEIQARVGVQF